MIELKQLTKRFDGFTAVDHLDLTTDGGNSTFEIPLTALDAVVGMTSGGTDHTGVRDTLKQIRTLLDKLTDTNRFFPERYRTISRICTVTDKSQKMLLPFFTGLHIV